MKFDDKKVKSVEVRNVCLKCEKEWNEMLAFDQHVPVGKLFGVCEECKHAKERI